jgi:hypothetical protein
VTHYRRGRPARYAADIQVFYYLAEDRVEVLAAVSKAQADA